MRNFSPQLNLIKNTKKKNQVKFHCGGYLIWYSMDVVKAKYFCFLFC